MDRNNFDLVELERIHRDKVGAMGYPLPDRFDSLLFVIQELGEWIDAKFTRQNPRYMRNNQKEVDPNMEMGDLLSMAMTSSLTTREMDPTSEDENISEHLSYVLGAISRALYYQADRQVSEMQLAILDLCNVYHKDHHCAALLARSHQKTVDRAQRK